MFLTSIYCYGCETRGNTSSGTEIDLFFSGRLEKMFQAAIMEKYKGRDEGVETEIKIPCPGKFPVCAEY